MRSGCVCVCVCVSDVEQLLCTVEGTTTACQRDVQPIGFGGQLYAGTQALFLLLCLLCWQASSWRRGLCQRLMRLRVDLTAFRE